MRSYEEMADNILKKYNDRLEQRKKRKAIIMRTALGCTGLCAAAVLGLSVWSKDTLKKDLESGPAGNNIITETDIPGDDITTTAYSGENVRTYTTSLKTYPYSSSVTTASSVTVSGKASVTGNNPAITITTKTSGNKVTASTTAKPAYVVTTKASAPVIAVTTTAKAPDFDIERSFDMKKLPAFLAALIATSTVSPVIPYAADSDLPVPMITPDTILAEYSAEREAVSAIAGGEFDLDLNEDGKFDIFDCYELYRSVWNMGATEDMREKCRLNADYDKNGAVDPADYEYLVYYYGLYKDITPELYDPEYYKANCPDTYGSVDNFVDVVSGKHSVFADDGSFIVNYSEVKSELGALTNDNGDGTSKRMGSYPCDELSRYKDLASYYNIEELFTDYLFTEMDCLRTNYKLVKKSFDDGTVDLDVDADGDLTIKDILYVMIYVENNNGTFTHQEKKNVDGRIKWVDVTDDQRIAELPDDIEQRCANMVRDYKAVFNNKKEAGAFMTDKYEVWMGSFGDYMTAYFFENKPLLPEYTEYSFYKGLYKNGENYNMEVMVQDYMKAAGITETENVFNEALFNKYFSAFVKDVEAGKKSTPDINFDGNIDKWDNVDVSLYIGEIYGGKTVYSGRKLSDNVLEKIRTDFDLNDDGVSGDIYDAMIAEFYYMYIGVPAGDNEPFEEYYRYKEGQYYEMIKQSDIERTGDADNDGQMKMNDAVLIMQSISNADKYELTSKGKFEADIYETGDGITPMDALEVQIKLLEG
ncbi:MAG: hypothetical protein IJK31_10325 [Ruminococcus sp.]|nr:hypothetical protein [Ruminococcus sp.]